MAALAILIILGSATHVAQALGGTEAVNKPNTSITISPASSVLELNPGDNYNGKFRITNTGVKAFDFDLSVSPYSVAGVDYKQDLESDTLRTQISHWIKFKQSRYHLEADQSVDVAYSVEVPTDVPAGGQYAVIFADTASSATSSGPAIDTVQRVGMLVYSRIQGDIRQAGSVESFNIPAWYSEPPLTASSLVANTGNVDFDAKYNLTVKTLFGREVFTSKTELSVLPDTERAVTLTWDKAPAIGIFNVTETVTVLGKSFATTKLVVILPLCVIIVLLIVVVLGLVALLTAARHHRNTKKQRRNKSHSRVADKEPL